MSEHGFPYRLVLLRHGQSEWNAAGVFTGWANAHLTAQGELEAARAGVLLAEHDVLPAVAHTSLQRRTIRTAGLVLAAADRDWIPVRRSWRLNGRHYGALQGRNKAEVLDQYGEQQVTLWRRSYDVPPPPLDAAAASSQAADPRYQALPAAALPRAESLADVTARLLPYWCDVIVPDLRAGRCVLVVSHGNTLRALVKYLEAIPDDRIAGLEIPTGIPLVYQLGPDLHPDALGGQYLDPHAARDGIKASMTRPLRRFAMNSRQGDKEHRIVVGVDGFESSKAALRWAIHQAELTGAEVEAVTAWHIPAGTGFIQAADMPDYQDDAFSVLGEAITEMAAVDPVVQVCPRVVEGRAGQVLVDAANGADLLVVGSRGHGGLAEALLGSVGQYCVHHAPCPVVIMRGKYEG